MRLLIASLVAAIVGGAAGFAAGWFAAEQNEDRSAGAPALVNDAKLARAYVASAFVTGSDEQLCEGCSVVEVWHVADRTWAVRYKTPTNANPNRERCSLVDLNHVSLRFGEQVFTGHGRIDCTEAEIAR